MDRRRGLRFAEKPVGGQPEQITEVGFPVAGKIGPAAGGAVGGEPVAVQAGNVIQVYRAVAVTIPQLQTLYETIFQSKLDKRNFRKKIFSMDVLIKLEEKDKTTSRKGAFLYRFDKKKYENDKWQLFINQGNFNFIKTDEGNIPNDTKERWWRFKKYSNKNSSVGTYFME